MMGRGLATLLLAGAGLLGTAAAEAAPPAGTEYSEAYFESADGTRLHADVLRPKGLRPGERTPVLLNVGPYNAHSSGPLGPAEQPPPSANAGDGFNIAREVRAFERGYSVVVVDSRGFGASQGCAEFGGPGDQADVYAAVEWAASQPWSNGRVAVAGTSGEGYSGISALATRPRGLAGVVAIAPPVRNYDIWYSNGVPRWMLAAASTYSVGFGQLPGTAWDNPEYHKSSLRPNCVGANVGEIFNPDGSSTFWRARDVFERASSSDVPVFGVQGFLDFQVVADQLTSLYPLLQNGRALWLGQFTHDILPRLRANIGREGLPAQMGRFLDEVLLGKSSDVHDPAVVVQEAPTLRWREEREWPPRDAKWFEMPVKSGHYVDTSGNVAGDRVVTTIGSVPAEVGPDGRGSWTFTRPLPHEAHLAGPPRLRVSAVGPPDARLFGLLYDVAPDGSALLIARGATVLRSGEVDIALFPQDWRLARGHRLGLLVSGAEDSWWIPHQGTAEEVEVRSGSLSLPALRCARDSFIEGDEGRYWSQVKHPIQVPQAEIEQRTVEGGIPPPQQSGGACRAIVQGPEPTCLARRSPIGPRNIGRIRLGFTRRRLLRLPVKPVRATARSFRYCVKRSKGGVRAVFSRRGRVLLVATTARSHGNRGVRPGRRVALRAAYPSRRALGRGVYRAGRRSRRLIGVRRGRVRFVAVASDRLIRNPRALRRHLRLAGL